MPPKKAKKAAAAAASNDFFSGSVLAFSGTFSKKQGEFKELVESNGGKVAASITKAVTHLVTTEDEIQNETTKVVAAKGKGIFLLTEDWVLDSIANGKKEDEAGYVIGSAAGKRTADVAASPAPAAAAPSKRARKTAAADPAPAPAPAPEPAAAASTKVQVIRKGSAPVDSLCRVAGTHHVIEDGSNVYNCMLNQVNITAGRNNNKFYVIQALEKDGGGELYVFTRWGRVGENGQQALQACSSRDAAIRNFESKFREKTKNSWADRENFVPQKDKYTLLEMDYGDEEEEQKKKPASAAASVTRRESTLEPAVQDLIRLIFDMKMMTAQLVKMEFDIEKAPLGKLKKGVILKAYEVLKLIEEKIKTGPKSELPELSSRFYTLIPHAYGRSVKPPVISDMEAVKAKIQMLEALSDIEIATSLISASEESDSDASMLDLNYAKLKCNISEVTDEDTLQRIRSYVKNSWESGTPPKVVNIYQLDREGEQARFKPQIGNRKMLWHGSGLTNFVGIISQGLRIAPPEAPCSGYRFGKGVYFADAMSLSARYCRAYGNPNFCMLLGDVALGRTAELERDQFMTKAISGTDSTHALGRIAPNPAGDSTDAKGCVWPLGKLTDTKLGKPVSCHENQYVVYSVDQCKLSYLIHCQN